MYMTTSHNLSSYVCMGGGKPEYHSKLITTWYHLGRKLTDIQAPLPFHRLNLNTVNVSTSVYLHKENQWRSPELRSRVLQGLLGGRLKDQRVFVSVTKIANLNKVSWAEIDARENEQTVSARVQKLATCGFSSHFVCMIYKLARNG